MANLVIEIGNTALKAAWCDKMTLGKTFRYQGERMFEFIHSLVEKEKPAVTVIASSLDLEEAKINRLREICGRLILMDRQHTEAVRKYSLPDYLSADRVASVIAARYLFKGKGSILFDFGTTITIDMVELDGEYAGGNISPGCRTRFKALNRYSRMLPLVELPATVRNTGDSVKSSIQSGVVSGIMFEIQGYLALFPEKTVVFTGGDALYFAKRMKNAIFVVCNLVLMGLALIADDYVERKN